MTGIHFKLVYNGKTYRFAPTVCSDLLFQAVIDHAASLVKEEVYTLCWNDGTLTMPLDSKGDFSNMLDKELRKSSKKPPCINLVVVAQKYVGEPEPPAPFEVAAAVVDDDVSESPGVEPSDCEDTISKLHSLLDAVDEKHRAAMRQSRAFVDELKTEKRLTVHSFTIRPTIHGLSGGDVELDFNFNSHSDYLMWKACMDAALAKLDIGESALRGNFMPHFVAVDRESFNMHVELATKDVKNVLDLLKPLAGRSDFTVLKVDEKKPKCVRLVPDFLEGASVKVVVCESRLGFRVEKTKKTKRTDFSDVLVLLQKLQPTQLRYCRNNLTREMVEFLEEAAHYVDHMMILNWILDQKKEDSLPLTLVQNILSKKCNYLNISDHVTKVTLAEVEELAKFFEEKDMKVSLAIHTKEKRMDIKVGAYRVKFAHLRAWSSGGNQFLIEHDDMGRGMEEIDLEGGDH